MTPKIVAQRLNDPIYLVQVDADNGRVLDIAHKRYYDPLPLQSILARGYWNDPASDTPSLETLLAQVPDAAA